MQRETQLSPVCLLLCRAMHVHTLGYTIFINDAQGERGLLTSSARAVSHTHTDSAPGQSLRKTHAHPRPQPQRPGADARETITTAVSLGVTSDHPHTLPSSPSPDGHSSGPGLDRTPADATASPSEGPATGAPASDAPPAIGGTSSPSLQSPSDSSSSETANQLRVSMDGSTVLVSHSSASQELASVSGAGGHLSACSSITQTAAPQTAAADSSSSSASQLDTDVHSEVPSRPQRIPSPLLVPHDATVELAGAGPAIGAFDSSTDQQNTTVYDLRSHFKVHIFTLLHQFTVLY